MAAAILVSTFGCNNGLILAGARVYYAMARDRLFFRAIARTNAHHVPAAALVAQGIWAALLTLPRTVSVDSDGAMRYGNVYTQLLEYIVAADLVFYYPAGRGRDRASPEECRRCRDRIAPGVTRLCR